MPRNRRPFGDFYDDFDDREEDFDEDDLDNWVTGFLHNRLARMTHFSSF